MKLTPIAAALLLAPLAMTAQAEVTFTPFATYHWFDNEMVEEFAANPVEQDVEDTDGYALGLGYRFTPALGLELNYGRTESNTEIDPAMGFLTSDPVRNSRLSLDGYYAFNADSTFSPYVLLGVGQGRYKNDTGLDIQDTIVNGAVGAFWRFTDKVALRVEARNVHNADADLNDQLALVGIEFSAGSTTAAAEEAPAQQAAAEAPAEAPVEQLAAAPADADGDGVADAADQCPATTAGATVDANGCELDTDKDGVADSADKCPDTKAGAAVNATGCYEVLQQQVAIEMNVKFATGKADIEGDASAEIQKVADFMSKYPTVNVTIEGHTDSRGNAAKNKALSQKRADAVKAEIVKLGVDAARLAAVGYGAERPVADNATEAGRAQNRRVVASAKAQTETIKMKK
ncbi:MAG: OmpA family protein [Pseudomonadota bacterium]